MLLQRSARDIAAYSVERTVRSTESSDEETGMALQSEVMLELLHRDTHLVYNGHI